MLSAVMYSVFLLGTSFLPSGGRERRSYRPNILILCMASPSLLPQNHQAPLRHLPLVSLYLRRSAAGQWTLSKVLLIIFGKPFCFADVPFCSILVPFLLIWLQSSLGCFSQQECNSRRKGSLKEHESVLKNRQTTRHLCL